ncbi:MAG: exosortase/archaeosortase family protein [Chloroflexota bacterium]
MNRIRSESIGQWAGLAVGVVIVVVLFASTLRWLFDSWLADPNYSHGFLVPLIAAFFVWRARDVFRARAPSMWGLVLLGLALALHLVATPLRIFPLSALALVLLLAATVVLVWGAAALRASAFAFLVLVLMIPIPFVDQISPTLEAFTATVAATSVGLLGTQAVTLGSQVQLPNAAFEIGAACSGLRSLASLVTLAVVFSGIVDGPRWGKALIVLAAMPIAILSNLVRVTSILQFAQVFGADAGLTYYHDYSSPVLFVIALGLLITFARTVKCSEIRFA